MYIQKISIQNYRNFKQLSIKLQKFTLIIGENNIGKTNLLNALGLIFSNEISFISKRTLELEDIHYYSVQEFKKEIADLKIQTKDVNFPEVKIDVWMKDFKSQEGDCSSGSDQEAVVGDWFIDSNLQQAKLTYLFAPKKDLKEWINEQRNSFPPKIDGEDDETYSKRILKSIDFPIKFYGYTIYGADNPHKQVDWYFLKMLKMEFLDALRDARKELTASGKHRLLYKILVNRPDDKYKEIQEQLIALNQQIESNEELKKIALEISEFLSKISLETESKEHPIRFEFSKVENSEMLKKLSLIYGTEPINVERNGLGRNNLLYISLILSHLVNKEDDNKEVFFRLIALEEPESHLHPHLQNHLAKNIENIESDNCGEIQVLVTSHSTQVTSKLKLDNTIILYRDENTNEIRAHYVLDKFKNELGKFNCADDRRTIRYLSRYLDATKTTMFFARKIILVEGISEQILVPLFFKLHTGISLEKIGCNVVNVNGVAFKHFLEVVKRGFFIKCLVLTDSDSLKKTKDRAGNLQRDYANDFIKVNISDKPTFEKDIIVANQTGSGKNILFDALVRTRRNSGKQLRKETGENAISTENFFSLLEVRNATEEKTGDYKADFATDLFDVLEENISRAKSEFTIPQYIRDGFTFIYPQNSQTEQTETNTEDAVNTDGN